MVKKPRDDEKPGGDAGMRDDDIRLFGEDQPTESPCPDERGKRILRLEVEIKSPSSALADVELQLAAAGDDGVLPAVLHEDAVKRRYVTLDTALLHRRN